MLKNIKINKKNVNKPIINGTFIVHYAGIKNNSKLFKKVVKYNGNLFVLNEFGETVGHIAGRLGHIKLLKTIIKTQPNLLNKKDINGKTVLNYLKEDLLFFLKKYQKHINSIDNVDKTGLTLLLHNIKNKKIVKTLIKYGANINYPKHLPPMVAAAHLNNFGIIKLLYEMGGDLNIMDDNYVTPFLIAVSKGNLKIVKWMLDNNVDKTYGGSESDDHPINIGLFNGNIKMISLLLNNDVDVNVMNRNMDTCAHFMFKLNGLKKIPYKIRREIVKRTDDLNKKNKNGDSVFNLLVQKDNWKKYKEILMSKCVDKNSRNKQGKTPLDFIKSGKRKGLTQCISLNNDKVNIKMSKYKYVNKSSFSTTSLFNVIYVLIVLKKYSNATIPFYYEKGKNKCEKTDGLRNTYLYMMKELQNFIIIWDIQCTYFPEHLLKTIKKIKKRFVIIRLSIVVTDNMNHANVLLYDKHNNTIERFDPYGVVPYGDSNLMDDYLEKQFDGITYLRPKDYMDSVSFQILSDEQNQKNIKYGDPEGYCLAWTYWYIEMRLLNANVKPKILVKHLINKINDSKNTFMEHIRNYANDLDKHKIKFFKSINLDKKKWYNKIYTKKDFDLITSGLHIKLKNIVSSDYIKQ